MSDGFVSDAVNAHSFFVFDVDTNLAIASKDENVVLPIASVTKLITASAFLDIAVLDATTSITATDVATEGKAGKLKEGDVYTNHELLYPLLLESSNDAAEAMYRVYPQLLDTMHTYTTELGLQHTVFEDPSGLSPHNTSTAKELALLTRFLYQSQPHIFDITLLAQFIGNDIGWKNNNPVFNDETYKGGKHGYTEEAQKTIVSFFDETLQDGSTRTIGYVVLGSTDTKGDIAVLRDQVQKTVQVR